MAHGPLARLITDVHLAELERAIRRYVHELGLDSGKIVKQTFRLVMRDVMSITAPKNLKQGRGAVKRDINRAILLLDPTKTKMHSLKKAILARDYNRIETLLHRLKKGRWNRMKVVPFAPTYHTTVRDRRGRVQRSKNIATPDKREHTKYVRSVQGHVGFTRAGWAPGANMSGAKVPQWVQRHKPPGSAKDETRSTMDPKMTAVHQAKTTNNIERSLINQTIKRRAATMHRDVNQVLKGRASRYFP